MKHTIAYILGTGNHLEQRRESNSRRNGRFSAMVVRSIEDL